MNSPIRLRLVDAGSLEYVQANLHDATGLLKSTGALVKAGSAKAFVDQGRPAQTWDARMVPNVPGLISDFRRSKKPKRRRFQARPALGGTGRLKGSIDFSVVSARKVEIGSNLDYASIQHFGLESESDEITEKMQSNLWAWLKGPGSEWKADLGWLLNSKYTGTTITIKVRARPIIDITEQDQEDLYELIGVALETEGGFVK